VSLDFTSAFDRNAYDDHHDQRAASRQLHQELAQQKNRQLMAGLLPSDPQTSAPKIRAGKIHMFTICTFGPFPETIFQKNVVETWEWQNNFFWGEMKMGDGRADFSLFPKNPICLGQARAFARKNEIRGCCETITLYGCPPLKQICFCTCATGGLPNDSALPCFMQRIALTTWTAKRGRRNWKPC